MSNTITVILKPNHQKSFYGKARVAYNCNSSVLTSYDTEVASLNREGNILTIRLNGWYSYTTAKHITEYLSQWGDISSFELLSIRVKEKWVERGYKKSSFRPSLKWLYENVAEIKMEFPRGDIKDITFVQM